MEMSLGCFCVLGEYSRFTAQMRLIDFCVLHAVSSALKRCVSRSDTGVAAAFEQSETHGEEHSHHVSQSGAGVDMRSVCGDAWWLLLCVPRVVATFEGVQSFPTRHGDPAVLAAVAGALGVGAAYFRRRAEQR